MKRINTIIESNTQPKGNNTLWIKPKEGGGKELKLGSDTIGNSTIENYSSIYLYNKLCQAAKRAGWANIVEVVASVLGGFPLCVDFSLKESEIDKVVKEFGEKVIEKLTPEVMYNLPVGSADSDATENRVFTIPATFTNIIEMTSGAYSEYRINNTSGFIFFFRDSSPYQMNIGFYIGDCLSDIEFSDSIKHYRLTYSSELKNVKKEYIAFDCQAISF